METRSKFRLKESCEYEDFYQIISLLEEKFGGSVVEKLDDFDGLFWCVRVDEVDIVVHYNIYEGVVLYPEKSVLDIEKANLTVKHIGERLLKYLQ